MSSGSHTFSCAVITLSDKGAAGQRIDTSGDALQKLFQDKGYLVKEYIVIPDEMEIIVDTLIDYVDTKDIDLIITTGGTGVSPRDVTPEATERVIEKGVPGMAEAMRAASLLKTPHAVISRGICGIRKRTLIINLPGSKKAALENIATLLPALPHALEKIKDIGGDCGG